MRNSRFSLPGKGATIAKTFTSDEVGADVGEIIGNNDGVLEGFFISESSPETEAPGEYLETGADGEYPETET